MLTIVLLFSSRVRDRIKVRIRFSVAVSGWNKLLCTRICATLGCNCHTALSAQVSPVYHTHPGRMLRCLYCWLCRHYANSGVTWHNKTLLQMCAFRRRGFWWAQSFRKTRKNFFVPGIIWENLREILAGEWLRVVKVNDANLLSHMQWRRVVNCVRSDGVKLSLKMSFFVIFGCRHRKLFPSRKSRPKQFRVVHKF